MKGLDDHIMGIHDPNAPFNELHWTEFFDNVVNRCSWLTDTLLDDPDTDDQLSEIMSEIWERRLSESGINDSYYSRSSRVIANFQQQHAQELADEFTLRYKEDILYNSYLFRQALEFSRKKGFHINEYTDLTEFIPVEKRMMVHTALQIHEPQSNMLWTDNYDVREYFDEVSYIYAETVPVFASAIRTRLKVGYKQYLPIIIQPKYVTPLIIYRKYFNNKNTHWSTGMFCFDWVTKYYLRWLQHNKEIPAPPQKKGKLKSM